MRLGIKFKLLIILSFLLVSTYFVNASTQINTVEDFINIKNNPTGEYTLNADLDFSSVTGYTAINFSGVLDGNGKHIKNFKAGTGLFIQNSGQIRNLGIVNTYIDGSDNIGSVCGINTGTVEKVYVIRNSYRAK